MLSPPVLDLARRARGHAAALAGARRSSSPPAASRSRSPSGWRSCTRAAFEVASLTRSWHGLTGGAAALTMTGGRRGYGPTMPGGFALPGAVRLPLPDPPLRRRPATARAWRPGFDLFDQASVGAPAAVVAEPVLSAGGVIVPPPGYFARLIELCDEREMLLILDECQTGLGRLGPDVRLRGLRGRARLPGAVEDARRRHPDRRRRDERDDRGGVPRARVHARDLARLRPAAGRRRARRARRGARRGPARPRRARRARA